MRTSTTTGFRDHYAILGVGAGATEDEIKAAYREAAKRCHPDLHPGDAEAAERFRAISEARRVLLSSTARAAFNLERMERQIRVDLNNVVHFRRPRPEAAPAGPTAESVAEPTPPVARPPWQGAALMLAGVLTVLVSVTFLPFVSILGGPRPVEVSGFDGGALAGVLNAGACSILIVLAWASWMGSGIQRRWEALLAFTGLWLLAITAAEFDPHLLVGGFFSSDLAPALGARALPVGVALTVCGAWQLRPALIQRRTAAARQPAGATPETA